MDTEWPLLGSFFAALYWLILQYKICILIINVFCNPIFIKVHQIDLIEMLVLVIDGGQETWNLCGHLRQPSFLWLIFIGLEAMAPLAPPQVRYWLFKVMLFSYFHSSVQTVVFLRLCQNLFRNLVQVSIVYNFDLVTFYNRNLCYVVNGRAIWYKIWSQYLNPWWFLW